MLSVSREPGCKLLISVLRLPEREGEETKPPLYGPIPWAWWHAALRLPGSSLRVATACWLVAGWNRAAQIDLSLGRWSDLGLSRQAASRGLACLDMAELVAVSLRPGRSPIVLLRDPEATPQ